MVTDLRKRSAWNNKLTFKLKLTGEGLDFPDETMEVQLEESLKVLPLFLAEVSMGPRLQKAEGAQDIVPAMSLQLSQPP
jgi:hypothetical protein